VKTELKIEAEVVNEDIKENVKSEDDDDDLSDYEVHNDINYKCTRNVYLIKFACTAGYFTLITKALINSNSLHVERQLFKCFIKPLFPCLCMSVGLSVTSNIWWLSVLMKRKSTIAVYNLKFVFISFTGNGSERLQDSDCGECETESGVSTSVGDRPGNCLYENAQDKALKGLSC